MAEHDLLILAGFGKFDWEDPMRISSLLTEEEIAVQETARDFSQEVLLPKVIEMYRKECE